MSHPTVVVPDATNYRQAVEFAPRYRYLRVVVSNLNTGSFTLAPTASQLLEWKLPSTDVYNLSKSYIEYSMLSGASTNPGYNYFHEDVPALFNSVSLSTSSGIDLCNLQNANNYLKVKNRMNTTTAQLLNADALGPLYPCNSLATANLKASADVYQAGNVYGAPAGTSYAGIVNYLEPQHLKQSVVEAGASQSVVSIYKQYQLGMISDTILGMDRDLFLPTDMYLRLNVFAPKLGFNSTSATVPLTGSANLNASVTFNNVVLFLAIEQNAYIVDSIKSKFASGGLKMQIPYTMAFRNNTSAAGQVGVQISFNRGYGKSLKKITHTVFNNTETGNTAFDCSNWNGSKITSYGTYINSRKLQDQDLSALQPTGTSVNQDDWLMNKKFYADSSIVNGGQYQMFWTHTDCFAEPQDRLGVPDENVNDGLPIAEPIIWQFNGTAVSALNHYTFATFLRDVSITPSGPIVEVF